MNELNCRGKILDLSIPCVMGILNVTPDSFYDGNKYTIIADAISRVGDMIKDGAKIIDIGGMSSRPGSKFVSVEEERSRVLPVLKQIRKIFPDIVISIDTFISQIAEIVLDEGADIINDISAGELDKDILSVVAKVNVPYIFMHMQGVPENMQNNPQYNSVVSDVLKYLLGKVRKLKSLGIEQLIADPGFGFGKTVDDNYNLLENFDVFKLLEIPVLAGISRKSMLYKYLDINPEESLNATTAVNMVALQKGAKILRVHDVKEAIETIKLYTKLNEFVAK